jgi:hypothetical protein
MRGRKVGDKFIIWTPEDWTTFAKAFMKTFPDRDASDARFRVKRAEFDMIQKKIFTADKQRAIFSSVLDKATKRIKPIIEALKVGEPVAKASQLIRIIWTDADYRAVANKLHLMRPDLNLLFAETPSGFSIAEFDEAQTALPLEKRRPSLSSSYYPAKLKKAYKQIQEGNDATTITRIGAQSEFLTIPAEEQKEATKSTKIFWNEADWDKLAATIHQRNPHAQYLASETLIGLTADELTDAQRHGLSADRRRSPKAIYKSMTKNRAELIAAFSKLRTRLETEKTSVATTIEEKEEKTPQESVQAVATQATTAPNQPQATLQSQPAVAAQPATPVASSAPLATPPQLQVANPLVEAARPFVAMVAQELSKALAETFGAKLFEMMLQGELTGKLRAPVSAPAAAPTSSGQTVADPDGSAVSIKKGGVPPSGGATPAAENLKLNEQTSHADSDDEDGDDDRQPPFDPRLPDPALQTRSSLFIKPNEARPHFHGQKWPQKKRRFKKHP